MLAGGILAILLSAVWIVHIIIFMLFSPPIHPVCHLYSLDLALSPVIATAAATTRRGPNTATCAMSTTARARS